MSEYDDAHWHIDRRIPITLLVMLLLQMIGAIIWATQLDARVNNVESQAGNAMGLSEKLARIDERLENMRQDVGGMRQQLNQITERLFK